VGESSLNLRFADCGRGNGDEDSGSKAGSSEGFGVGSGRDSGDPASSCGALLPGEESILRV
jgi:hypothetical protein